MCTPEMIFQCILPSPLALVRAYSNRTAVLAQYSIALVLPLHGSKDIHGSFAHDTLLPLRWFESFA